MATKKTSTPTKAATSTTPSRRAVLKTGAKVIGAGLVTTMAARDARAAGSWGGGNSGGGGGGNSGGGGSSGSGNNGGGRGRGRGR